MKKIIIAVLLLGIIILGKSQPKVILTSLDTELNDTFNFHLLGCVIDASYDKITHQKKAFLQTKSYGVSMLSNLYSNKDSLTVDYLEIAVLEKYPVYVFSRKSYPQLFKEFDSFLRKLKLKEMDPYD
jgi:hypothetical protein